jgi:hypothetical protein
MPRKPIDLHAKVREMLLHSAQMPAEHAAPLAHFDRTANDSFNLIRYFERRLEEGAHGAYEAVADRHLAHLRRIVLGHLLQSFERFIKETAITCVDLIAPYVFDDRFKEFNAGGNVLAAHFVAGSVGKAMCESSTWFDLEEVNRRFRNILKPPFCEPNQLPAMLFPLSGAKTANRDRAETLSLLWQVRHTLAHNVGVMTGSDVAKLRILSKQNIAANRLLEPTADDLRSVKRFLSETATWMNATVGTLLASALTIIHHQDPALFAVQQVANDASQRFGYSVTVDGAAGVV